MYEHFLQKNTNSKILIEITNIIKNISIKNRKLILNLLMSLCSNT